MNRGYVRAHLERAEEGKPLRFVAATEGRKADGIDLRMSGARLERFRANPVIGYNHSYWGRQSLPIGRAADVRTDGDRLMMDVEFDPDDEFAMEVERKYRNRFLNAVSIGFDVHEWESENDNFWRGGVATDWELLETSSVPIPMDASAVVAGGRGLHDGFDALVAGLPDLSPVVQVERDSVTLTRSLHVSEQLIRQADPLTLSAAIGRALAQPLAPAPEPKAPEPAPQEPAGDEPSAEELATALAERDDYAERLRAADAAHTKTAAERDVLAAELEQLKAPKEPEPAPDEIPAEDGERLLAAFSF